MNLDLTKPDGLSEVGSLACDVITGFLTSRNLAEGEPYLYGAVFISPEEYAKMLSAHDGWQGELIVDHAFGPHCEAFDWDRRNYTLMEELRAELNKIGCYAEQIDGSFSAVFHRPASEERVPYDVTGMNPNEPYN